VELLGLSFFVSSTVFYTSLLLGVFVIYLFDGPVATRNSIVVIIAVSAMVPLINLGLNLQAELSGTPILANLPMANLRINSVSVIATLIDLIFLAILWEYLSKLTFNIPLYLRIYLTLLSIMWLDVLLFGTGAFAGSGFYWDYLKNTLLSRFIISIFTFPILWAYIVWQNSRHKISVQARPAWRVLGDMAEMKQELLTAKQELAEQKKNEDVIRESELRFRNLFEYAPVALWEEDFSVAKEILKQLQTDGIVDIGQYLDDNPDVLADLVQKVRIVNCNQAALDLHQAKDKADLYENLDNIFTPESFVTFKAEMVAIAEDQNEFESEAILKTIQGEERHVQLKLITLRTDVRDYSRTLVVTADITGNKLAEVALRDSEKKFRDLFEKSGDANLIIRNDQFVDCNQATVTMLGYLNKAEMLNTHPAELSPDEQPDGQKSFAKAEEMMRIAVAKGSHRFEWVHRRQNGATFPVEVLLTLISGDGENKIIHTVWRDITRRKQAEQEKLDFEKKILQTQKLESLGVLAGGIAHDFNNILMGILGYADLALSSLSPSSPAKEYVEGINSASRKAADLIKQMLAYSGKGKFTLESINLNHLIQETVQMLSISISKNAVLKFNYAQDPVVLEGDPSQIRQIIMNLVINASEAIEKHSGVISLSTGQMYCDQDYIDSTGFAEKVSRKEPLIEGLYAFVEVSDTGIGMSKDTIHRIFDPFFTTKFTGRGLGLSAVLGIANGHHGMVKIYSEEHKGTSFKVLFPLSEGSIDVTKINASEELAEKWQGRGTILIADDEEAVRSIGKHMIRKLGFEVLTAADGQEAIELFKQHRNEIVGVLLDLTMPHKDGAEVFQEIRGINPDVKVILSSGYNEQDATQQFIGKGLAGFIQKPYVSADLVIKIKEVMGQDS
ncbi:MAG: response regulator, partial [Candidatus Marinimicrobia bacterium]|nr:response regulator [Candidatus Neomarinimicrobiota bacterium]